MPRLNEKDLAILRARGYKNGPTTLRDDEVPAFVKPEKKVKKTRKAKNQKHPLVGKLLHCSWGYDMTINDFCKIIEVSPTGKTVKCRMVTRKVTGDPWHPCGDGKAIAGSTEYGPVFRLRVSVGWHGEPSFHGSYPYCLHTDDDHKNWKAIDGRKGYFSICSENDTFYENRCD